MPRLRWILFALVVCLVPAAYGSEKFSQCRENCPPGDDSCSQCCSKQADVVFTACDDKCDAGLQKCRAAAVKKCSDIPDPSAERICFDQAMLPCAITAFYCTMECAGLDPVIPGNCPGEVRPQKCQFDCQKWNPATKSCVGTPKNGCPR